MRRIQLAGTTFLAFAVLASLSIEPATAEFTTAAPFAGQNNGPGRPGGPNQGQRPGGGQPGQGQRPGGQRPGGQRPGGGQTKPTPPPQQGNRPGPKPGNGNRPPNNNNRPPQRPQAHRPPPRPVNRPHYNFGDGGNGFRLRRYFNSDMARLNRNRRHHFLVGGYFPRQYVTYLQPIPPDVLGYLPPVPPGYAIGYYDGYTVVYDPTTFLIASVLDLFRY